MASIKLTWSHPINEIPVEGYIVGYRQEGSSDNFTEIFVTTGTEIILDDLIPNVIYEGYIKSNNGGGNISNGVTWLHNCDRDCRIGVSFIEKTPPLPPTATPTPTPNPTSTPFVTSSPTPTPTSTSSCFIYDVTHDVNVNGAKYSIYEYVKCDDGLTYTFGVSDNNAFGYPPLVTVCAVQNTVNNISDGNNLITEGVSCDNDGDVPTPTPTSTPITTATPNPTSTPFPTAEPTPSATPNPTPLPTLNPTPFPTQTPNPTEDANFNGPTPLPTSTPYSTPEPTHTQQPTSTPVPTLTPTPTDCEVDLDCYSEILDPNLPTATPNATLVPNPTPNPTSTNYPTPEPTHTQQPTSTPNPTDVPNPTPVPTSTPNSTPNTTPNPTPNPTINPTPIPSSTPTSTPEPDPTPIPSSTPTSTPEPDPTPYPTPDVTPIPSSTPNPTASETPQPTLTSSPNPTATPLPTQSSSQVCIMYDWLGSQVIPQSHGKAYADTTTVSSITEFYLYDLGCGQQDFEYLVNNFLTTGYTFTVSRSADSSSATFTLDSLTDNSSNNYWTLGVTHVSGSVTQAPLGLPCHQPNSFCFNYPPQLGQPIPEPTSTPYPTPASTSTPEPTRDVLAPTSTLDYVDDNPQPTPFATPNPTPEYGPTATEVLVPTATAVNDVGIPPTSTPQSTPFPTEYPTPTPTEVGGSTSLACRLTVIGSVEEDETLCKLVIKSSYDPPQPTPTPTVNNCELVLIGSSQELDCELVLLSSFSSLPTTYIYYVINDGANHYMFYRDQYGYDFVGNDPQLTIKVGDTLNITNLSGGHPLYFKTSPTTGTGDQVNGVTGQGATNGTVSWTPTVAGTYYYQCSAHINMSGIITVTN